MIVGHLGEGVDPGLVDQDPVRDADFGPIRALMSSMLAMGMEPV